MGLNEIKEKVDAADQLIEDLISLGVTEQVAKDIQTFMPYLGIRLLEKHDAPNMLSIAYDLDEEVYQHKGIEVIFRWSDAQPWVLILAEKIKLENENAFLKKKIEELESQFSRKP